ncbi:DNA-binding response regulator [Pseudoflavonifractor sp. 524-17]|uniref:response regulator transcription factor n=1 Tax=Pseudoflavonifractor sp. 524-17 TaxID=2304577 RepID=UPI00137A6838|nr:response regulator transcription factor [Pseudoflavonifractor sp. 524-17]NCE64851.1 DNA-binding response regulator [Pseudoflavonifractor sp. 524-17]
MAHRIFIVEDDPSIRQALSALLERYGYTCLTTGDFHDVAGQILSSGAHLVLLDLNLPYQDGCHICQQVRAASSLPIIVVTSRDTELDEVMSMSLGADDFLTKPYHTQVLLARIARLLQRAYPAQDAAPTLRYGPLTLDLGRGAACVNGQSAQLTRNETRILQRLMAQPGEIVSRCALMEALWHSDAFVDDNTLTVNVTRLRRRLEELGLGGALTTRRGQGYCLCL